MTRCVRNDPRRKIVMDEVKGKQICALSLHNAILGILSYFLRFGVKLDKVSLWNRIDIVH